MFNKRVWGFSAPSPHVCVRVGIAACLVQVVRDGPSDQVTVEQGLEEGGVRAVWTSRSDSSRQKALGGSVLRKFENITIVFVCSRLSLLECHLHEGGAQLACFIC